MNSHSYAFRNNKFLEQTRVSSYLYIFKKIISFTLHYQFIGFEIIFSITILIRFLPDDWLLA